MNTNGIILLGLGPGDPALLTRQAWSILNNIPEIYLRTRQHPTVNGFPPNLKVHSFDHLYDSAESFETVYYQIVEKVLILGKRTQGVVYAVPGHPFIAETTSLEIARRARLEDIPHQIVEGISFLEPTFTLLGVDPLPHTSIIDALELTNNHHPPFPPDTPAIIAQIYSKTIASEIKLLLMEVYPDKHPVKMVHRAGTPNALVESIPLFKIDHSPHIGLLTTLYIPSLGPDTSFESFQDIITHLRAPDGCPWDREQTHQSLRPHLLEETYEVLTAIDLNNPQALQEELGDLLLQIVLHSQIANEYGEFRMADILKTIHTKIVQRHPHVFEDVDIEDVDDVIRNWELIKSYERKDNDKEDDSLLDGIPMTLPALAQAEQYQRRASRVGFDWIDKDDFRGKVKEVLNELRNSDSETTRTRVIGDLLFAIVNLSRQYNVDPESALREANSHFRTRFTYIEKTAKSRGKPVADLNPDEIELLWLAAKRED
jgi:tetrapyrrole methylase family protein/MazG family protein